MGRKPSGKPVGRPQKKFDSDLFEDMCFIQCTQSEICSFLKINDDTLRTKVLEKYGADFSTTYKKFSEGGKKSLRRYQFDLAKKNTAMAIWLGKQYLGQREPQEEKPTLSPNDQLISQLLDTIKNLQAKIDAIESKASPSDSPCNPSL